MIGERSTEELAILKKERVADLDLDESTCIRFLIARDFDEGKAEEMLRNHAKWRVEINLDYLVNVWTLPPDLKEDFKFQFIGKSHNGGPVLWVEGGLWNFRKFVEQGRRNDILKFSAVTFEQVLNQVKKHGNRKLVAIYGFDGLTYHKVSHFESIRLVFATAQMLELNYPEIVQNVVVVNAPYPFYVAWNIISPLLSKRTASKIQVFSSDKSTYVPVLRRLCPDESIPAEYLPN